MRIATRVRWATAVHALGWAVMTGCGGGDSVTPPDEEEPETVPLDGRGGGVLAYTLQPGPDSGIHEIHVMNADGTGSRRLITASIGLNHHDWSPDGSRLAAVGYVDANSSTWSVHVFNADGTGLTRLTRQSGVWDNEPTWSPDGSSIVFTRTYTDENFRSEIWMMDSDGDNQRWIGAEGFVARWSPDGTRLIYQSRLSELAGGQSDIYTCAVDGTDVRAVTETAANELAPVWSPNGQRIAFVADYDGDYDLYVMNSDGSGLQKLTDTAWDEWVPRWSPDGTMIAFASDVASGGRSEVYLIDSGGTNLRRLTETPSPRSSLGPTWRPN